MIKTYRILGQKGRITIPAELRYENDMCCGDMLNMEQTDEGILIRNVSAEERWNIDDIDDLDDAPDVNEKRNLFDTLDALTPGDRWRALAYLSARCAERK